MSLALRSLVEDYAERNGWQLALDFPHQFEGLGGEIEQGYINAEIADKLYLKRSTTRSYVSSILDKLGVEDRTQAAILASQAGLTET